MEGPRQQVAAVEHMGSLPRRQGAQGPAMAQTEPGTLSKPHQVPPTMQTTSQNVLQQSECRQEESILAGTLILHLLWESPFP